MLYAPPLCKLTLYNLICLYVYVNLYILFKIQVSISSRGWGRHVAQFFYAIMGGCASLPAAVAAFKCAEFRVFHLKRRVRNAESFFEKTIHAIDKAVGVHGAVFRIDTDVAG